MRKSALVGLIEHPRSRMQPKGSRCETRPATAQREPAACRPSKAETPLWLVGWLVETLPRSLGATLLWVNNCHLRKHGNVASILAIGTQLQHHLAKRCPPYSFVFPATIEPCRCHALDRGHWSTPTLLPTPGTERFKWKP